MTFLQNLPQWLFYLKVFCKKNRIASSVYIAQHQQLKSKVAVKVFDLCNINKNPKLDIALKLHDKVYIISIPAASAFSINLWDLPRDNNYEWWM